MAGLRGDVVEVASTAVVWAAACSVRHAGRVSVVAEEEQCETTYIVVYI